MRYYITKHCPESPCEISCSKDTLSAALEEAQQWVLNRVSRQAYIHRGKDGPLVYHYWQDNIGMQYVRYLRGK